MHGKQLRPINLSYKLQHMWVMISRTKFIMTKFIIKIEAQIGQLIILVLNEQANHSADTRRWSPYHASSRRHSAGRAGLSQWLAAAAVNVAADRRMRRPVIAPASRTAGVKATDATAAVGNDTAHSAQQSVRCCRCTVCMHRHSNVQAKIWRVHHHHQLQHHRCKKNLKAPVEKLWI